MQALVAAPGRVHLVSRVAGRERWFVPEIEGRPRRAASLEASIRQHSPLIEVHANPLTGRVLLRWNHRVASPETENTLEEALQEPLLPPEVFAVLQAEHKKDGKAQSLVQKLILGGVKLFLVFSNRLIWGVAVGPLTAPLAILSVSTIIITGYDFLRALGRTIRGRTTITTSTLIGAATISSVALRENTTALIVLWLLNLGEYLEMVTLRRTARAIRHLLADEDEEAWVLLDGVEMSCAVKDIEPGWIVSVRSGRRIGIDGIVEGGEATVNEAAITGESMPVRKRTGDLVYAGTVVLAGTILIRVTDVGSNTVVGRLIERVEEAQTLRPRIQTVGDAFAKRVVPGSFVAAMIVFLVTRDARRALTMMLIACPCAAGLATPTAVSASIGNVARRGILVKGGRFLEALAEVDTMCFDKTGTLTDSHPTVRRVVPVATGYDVSRVISLAARAEVHSQHPLAIAVLEYTAKPANGNSKEHFELLAGRGVRVWDADDEVLVGNQTLMIEQGVPVTDAALRAVPAEESAVFVAHCGQLVGAIGVTAALRPEAPQAMRRLRELGVRRLMMLTGDTSRVAGTVAHAAGITEYRSQLLPQEKFDAIQELRQTSRSLAMVGDGVNDAPALAIADVGMAMGTGRSDVAIETADIVLASDDLRHIPALVKTSRRTLQIVRQNYSIAVGVNSIGLGLAALGRINPIIAAVLHNLSTILVVTNSARLIHYEPNGRDNLALPPIPKEKSSQNHRHTTRWTHAAEECCLQEQTS
jgi:manganese/zinc-transporting P-type ATPase C